MGDKKKKKKKKGLWSAIKAGQQRLYDGLRKKRIRQKAIRGK